MMRSIWYYRCDEGHEWKIFRDMNALDEVDAVCPFGHPAVTLQKRELVQPYEITLRPAEEVVDTVKNRTRNAKRFYIVIRVQNEPGKSAETTSQGAYTWSEAAPVVEHLLSMPLQFVLRHIQKYQRLQKL